MLELVIFFIIILFHLLATWILLYNFFTAPKIQNDFRDLIYTPLVSILIPVRNEQNNIEECLKSIINQHYYYYEVMVLNDDSKDLTGEIVKKFTANNTNIKLIEGKKLPKRWTGKNWACHQLVKEAHGEVLLFLDADIRLSEYALNNMLYLYQSTGIKMLSVFPSLNMKSFGELFVVPIKMWFMLTLIPLKKMFTSSNKIFTVANGQLLMFDRKTYEKIKGHEAVKTKLAEGMTFAKLLKRKSVKFISALGGDGINCRMYNGFDNSINGFIRNFYPSFEGSAIAFILMIILLTLFYFGAILYSFINFLFIIPVLLIVFQRITVSLIINENILISLLHPFQMIIMFLVGIDSVYRNKNGKIEWKDRIVK